MWARYARGFKPPTWEPKVKRRGFVEVEVGETGGLWVSARDADGAVKWFPIMPIRSTGSKWNQPANWIGL